MREVWETPYANALLKIERADKHISDIEQRLLPSDNTYYMSQGINANSGNNSCIAALRTNTSALTSP